MTLPVQAGHFVSMREGGFDYLFEFNLPVLLLDLIIGTILAGVLGWFVGRTKSAPEQ